MRPPSGLAGTGTACRRAEAVLGYTEKGKAGLSLIRGFLALFLLTTWPAPAAQQTAVEEGSLDASQKLFAVMAAINAAGYDAELQSPSNSTLRAVVRREVAAKNPACLEELRTFFAVHHRDDATAELGQRPPNRRPPAQDGRPMLEGDLPQREILQAGERHGRTGAGNDFGRAGEEGLPRAIGAIGDRRPGGSHLLLDN